MLNAQMGKYGGEDTCESSYDLSLEFKPIGYYTNDSEEMVRQMFKVVGTSYIKSFLPKSLMSMPILQLQRECVEALNNIKSTDIKNIFAGKIMQNLSQKTPKSTSPSYSSFSDFEESYEQISSLSAKGGSSHPSSQTPSPHFIHSTHTKQHPKRVIAKYKNRFGNNKRPHKELHMDRTYDKINHVPIQRQALKGVEKSQFKKVEKTERPLPPSPPTVINKPDDPSHPHSPHSTIEGSSPVAQDRSSTSVERGAKYSKEDHNIRPDIECTKTTSAISNLVELELRAKAIKAMISHQRNE